MSVLDSPFEDVTIPELSITERVFAGLAGRADEPALIDGPSGRVLSVAALMDRTRRLAGGLAARGFGAGCVVAIMAPNLPEYAVLFHAVAWAGGTVTTINPTYTADELRYQLRDSGAALLVTVPALLETARAGAAGTGVREIATLGAAEGATPIEAMFGAPMAAQAPVDLAAHTLALPYSSGTTGLTKGVRLSHRNLVANAAQVGPVFRHATGERTLALLPFFHIYGMLVLMNYHLAAGGVVVTMPRFDLETMLRLIETHRVRRLYVAPPIVLALAKHPLVDAFDLGSLDYVLSGAAPLGAELEAACASRLGCAVLQGYGMTETSPVTHA
nr:AMP-binding protein [Paracoccaceae bacterium]